MNNLTENNQLQYYALLKNEIEQTFGKKIIASKDCVLLSEDLFAKIFVKVNSNTLRRFFGLVKTNYLPSATIIDILCRYCGFASFEEFTALKTMEPAPQENDHYAISILNYLSGIFKYTPASETDNTFSAMVKYTIQFVQRHAELYDRFHRAISKTSNGQRFYFEKYINTDGLNSFYGTGLRYYLVENNSMAAQVFGQSLLCIKNWLSDDSAGVKKHYDALNDYYAVNDAGTDAITSAHLFATQILYANMYGLPIEKMATDAQKAHAAIISKAENEDVYVPYFESIVSTVLLLTGHPKAALFYIGHPFNMAGLVNKEPGFLSMEVVKALAYAKAGNLQQAEALYQRIHPSQFYFLSKKTDTILYLFLTQCLHKDSAGLQEQLHGLIDETGFTRLHLLKSKSASIESLQFFSVTNAHVNTRAIS